MLGLLLKWQCHEIFSPLFVFNNNKIAKFKIHLSVYSIVNVYVDTLFLIFKLLLLDTQVHLMTVGVVIAVSA